jgi:site-specific DNA-methyltransferase (adenine-specific)
MNELRIETVNINSLTPDPANARKHDGKNLQAIAHSLEKFGQRKPICVTPDSIVVAGNGTLEAAKNLGWTEIVIARTPVGWTWEQIRAFALADNRTAELAEWDDKILADQLLELDANGWELEELGFANLEPPVGQDDDDEPLSFDDAPTRAKLGEVWKLGNHRLMCGDSTDKTTVAKLLNGIKADMAFTDPPYGVSYTGGLQFKDGVVEKNNREMIENDDIDLYADVFPVLSEFVNGACYIWFAGTKASNLYTAAEKFGTIHALIIWVKNGGYGALNANYKQKHEPCLYWKPKNANLNFVGETTETTVWNIDKDGINKLHPTQKPIALAMKAIQNHKAKTVLDLFGGSGSTLIACEKTNRSCFMMELDPKYADVIIKRWEDLTGKTAELIED